jgi:hypothetical protein
LIGALALPLVECEEILLGKSMELFCLVLGEDNFLCMVLRAEIKDLQSLVKPTQLTQLTQLSSPECLEDKIMLRGF